MRGVRDASGHVDVATTAGGSSVTAKTTLQFVSTYLIAGSVTPQFAYSQTYYASTLRLSADAQPLALSLEIRPDAGRRTYASASLGAGGVTIGGFRSRSLAAAPGSDRWVTVDGINFAGAFTLPASVLAAHDRPITIYSALRGVAEPYVCTNVPTTHPKDAPANDGYLHCEGGKNDATVWYDPDTLIPDKIELPYERATFFRRQ